MIAVEFAKAGADIVIGDINDADMVQTCAAIRALGRKADWLHVDVRDSEQVNKLITFPATLDIVIHGAGVMMSDHFLDAKEEDIKRVFDINIMGSNNVVAAAMRRLLPQKSGKILLIASVAGRIADYTVTHYRMCKAAVLILMMSVACIAAKHNVNINAICPGIVRTDMWEQLLDGKSKQMNMSRDEVWKVMVTNLIPMGRPQTVEDIAAAALFLCSTLADNITGQALNVDGGQCMHI